VTDWPDLLNIDNYFLRDRLGEGLGDHVALRLDDRNVTYREVDRASSGFAGLLSDAGAGPGDRVMIVLPDGLEFVSALFAVFRIGAVAVMLNPDLTEEARSFTKLGPRPQWSTPCTSMSIGRPPANTPPGRTR
jgi:acyl-coenzyme A synthetase/AMP-(fatty) acid ligase